VLLAYLVFTTVLGAKLAGQQATIRDFFLAGRKIPWPAVAGSNIATEISAVTLISVPAVVYAPGGDLTYLQLAVGLVLARVIVAIWFVPAFYQREIYSPYEFMGHWLGPQARAVTTGLFVLGAVLGQSVRVLLTAIVLELISGIPLWASIWLIGAAAVLWTWLGGITTVIWTDVIQFFVFLVGMIAALVFVLVDIPGGWGEMIRVAAEHGKLRLWNLSTDPNQAFTLWAGLFGNTIMCLAIYGTDQTMAQRMFCCRGPRQATYAVLASSAALLVTVVAVLVGLGLFAFYQHFPLSGQALAAVQNQNDRIFPVFILEHMPIGMVGLIIAGVFAAAISTLDGVLVALSQVVITGFYRPWREGGRRHEETEGTSDEPTAAENFHYVRVSKILVVGWAIALCAMAQVSKLAWDHYKDILDLALAMATYTGGPLLAAFFLAFWRLNVDARGILWAAPLSVLTVFAVTWHQPWARMTTAVVAGLIGLGWVVLVRLNSERRGGTYFGDRLGTVLVAVSGAGAVFLSWYVRPSLEFVTVAWPWNVPIGFVVALALGYLLSRPRATVAGAC
jgi:SSS family transporter